MTSPADYGFDAVRSIAGFVGSVVYVFFDKQTTPFAIMGSLITGTAVANYLGPIASEYIANGKYPGAVSFIVGLCGTIIVPTLLTAARKWKPGKPEGSIP